MQMNIQDVVLDPLAGGPGKNWKVTHGGQSGSSPGSYPHVSLTPDSGPWLIHFKINDPGNSVTFAADPIWVQQGSKPGSHAMDPQITAVIASADGKELFVLDKNDNPSSQTLYYSMQFNKHGQLDPIIDNGGHTVVGPRPTTGMATNSVTLQYTVLGLVIVAAFVVGAVVGWLVRRR
jgi:hypothetical protein